MTDPLPVTRFRARDFAADGTAGSPQGRGELRDEPQRARARTQTRAPKNTEGPYLERYGPSVITKPSYH